MTHLLIIIFASFSGAYLSSMRSLERIPGNKPIFLSTLAGQVFQLTSMLLFLIATVGLLVLGFKELRWFWVLGELLFGYILISLFVERTLGTLLSYYLSWIPPVAVSGFGWGRRLGWF